MMTLRWKRIIVALFVLTVFSMYQFSTVIAADKPLLLLASNDIDDKHFSVDIKLSGMPAFAAFELPIAFDGKCVRVCGYDDESGAFTQIEDGDKTASDITEGKSGIMLSPALVEKDKWHGTVFDNDIYPYISNSEGLLKFVMFTLSSRAVFQTENDFCSIYFERIGDGDPKVRIATEENAEIYDEAAPQGVMFSISGKTIPVVWEYDGDVFEDNADIVIPANDDHTNNETDDGEVVSTHSSDDADSTDNPDGQHDSGNLSDGSMHNSPDGGEEDKNVNEKDESDISDLGNTAGENNVNEEITFIDVDASYWAKDYIYALAQQFIINGYDDHTFRPQANITRAELVTMASKAMGYDTESNEVMFTDSDADVWYNKYLTTAYKNNIITGYPGGEFRPQNNISREDLCVIMYRIYFAKDDVEYELSYTDSTEISEYAKKAVKILSAKGILSGRDNNMFEPKAYATRAEVSKILCFCMAKASD